MYVQSVVRQILMMTLLMVLAALAMSGCGGGGSQADGAKAGQGGGHEKGARDRPLPQDPQPMLSETEPGSGFIKGLLRNGCRSAWKKIIL